MSEPNSDYNSFDDAIAASESSDVPQTIIVPSGPPEFGPGAARALIRLLRAVHREHTSSSLITPGEAP